MDFSHVTKIMQKHMILVKRFQFKLSAYRNPLCILFGRLIIYKTSVTSQHTCLKLIACEISFLLARKLYTFRLGFHTFGFFEKKQIKTAILRNLKAVAFLFTNGAWIAWSQYLVTLPDDVWSLDVKRRGSNRFFVSKVSRCEGIVNLKEFVTRSMYMFS